MLQVGEGGWELVAAAELTSQCEKGEKRKSLALSPEPPALQAKDVAAPSDVEDKALERSSRRRARQVVGDWQGAIGRAASI